MSYAWIKWHIFCLILLLQTNVGSDDELVEQQSERSLDEVKIEMSTQVKGKVQEDAIINGLLSKEIEVEGKCEGKMTPKQKEMYFRLSYDYWMDWKYISFCLGVILLIFYRNLTINNIRRNKTWLRY
jgi:hypothetical protein